MLTRSIIHHPPLISRCSGMALKQQMFMFWRFKQFLPSLKQRYQKRSRHPCFHVWRVGWTWHLFSDLTCLFLCWWPARSFHFTPVPEMERFLKQEEKGASPSNQRSGTNSPGQHWLNNPDVVWRWPWNSPLSLSKYHRPITSSEGQEDKPTPTIGPEGIQTSLCFPFSFSIVHQRVTLPQRTTLKRLRNKGWSKFCQTLRELLKLFFHLIELYQKQHTNEGIQASNKQSCDGQASHQDRLLLEPNPHGYTGFDSRKSFLGESTARSFVGSLILSSRQS